MDQWGRAPSEKFEAEVKMYKSHITLTLTRVAVIYSTGKTIWAIVNYIYIYLYNYNKLEIK